MERAKATDQKLVISPLTGEKIPADKLAEHMRLNTIDRDYFKQRELTAEGKETEEPVFAAGPLELLPCALYQCFSRHRYHVEH